MQDKRPAPIATTLLALAGLTLIVLAAAWQLGLFDREKVDQDLRIIPRDDSRASSEGPAEATQYDILDGKPPKQPAGQSKPAAKRPQDKRSPVQKNKPAPFPGIRGRVLDGQTGRALEWFTAWVRPIGESDIAEWARDRSGRIFRNTSGILILTGLEDGVYTVLIRSAGYQDLVQSGLTVPQEEDYLDFGLAVGTSLRGRIVDTDDKPVKGMAVVITCTPSNPDDPPPARSTAVTDEKGYYLFGDLPEGTYDIYLRSRKNPVDRALGIYLAGGNSLTRDFIVPSFTRLVFKITTEKGTAINNVVIRLISKNRTFSKKTNHLGEVVIDRVPPGEYDLTIFKRRFNPLSEKVMISSVSGEFVFERVLEAR